MGKVSPKEKALKTPKRKRRSRTSKNKYLRPGALAQLRYSKASSTKSCTDLGKKRIVLFDSKKVEDDDLVITQKVVPIQETPLMMSPEKFLFSTFSSPLNLVKQNSLLKTPKTPCFEGSDSDSRLEGLPMDLLVKIICHLHHDQLRAVLFVSKRIKDAVELARRHHFNYTTPDRARQEMLNTMTPLATEHWPFLSKVDHKGLDTPKAPRQVTRPPSRLKHTEMKQVAAALFQEKTLPSRCMFPPKNRILRYEEELCQAVAQNKLL